MDCRGTFKKFWKKYKYTATTTTKKRSLRDLRPDQHTQDDCQQLFGSQNSKKEIARQQPTRESTSQTRTKRSRSSSLEILINIRERTADVTYFLFVTPSPPLSQPSGLQLINRVVHRTVGMFFTHWYKKVAYSTVLHFDSWATELL